MSKKLIQGLMSVSFCLVLLAGPISAQAYWRHGIWIPNHHRVRVCKVTPAHRGIHGRWYPRHTDCFFRYV